MAIDAAPSPGLTFVTSSGEVVAGRAASSMSASKRIVSFVPSWTTLCGVAVGVVGFFVIPVIGLFIGFVLGVYLAEYRRVGGAAAWPSTKEALRAVGVSMLIELAAGVLAALVWVAGVVAT